MVRTRSMKSIGLLSLALASMLLLAACGGTNATPASTTGPASEPPSRSASSPTSEPNRTDGDSHVGVDGAAGAGAYGQLADRALNDIVLLVPLLSQVGIALSSNPDQARETAEAVETVRDALGLTLTQMNDAAPPQRYEELHQQLVDAMTLYVQAAEALLPGGETGEADYWTFQGLMQEAGGNAHGAGATLGQLNASRADRQQ